MSPARISTRIAVAVLVTLLAGCDSLTGNPQGGLAIEGEPGLNLPWGDSVALTATDGHGVALDGRAVTWSSDHSGIATVSPTGVVRGHAIGSTTIRASYEGARASIRVAVVVEGAEDIMQIRITGDVEEEYYIYPGSGAYSFAVGLQADFPDRPAWRFGYLMGETYSVAEDRAAGVVFALPGDLALGVHQLTAASTDDLLETSLIDLPGAIAYLYRETSARHYYVYPLTSGLLEITELDSLGASFAVGSVRGRASFVADEYAETYDGATRRYTPTPTGRAVEVEVVFHIPAGIYYGGYMDVAVSGGSYESPEQLEGWADGYVDPVYGTAVALRVRDTAGGLAILGVTIEEAAVAAHSIGAGAASRWTLASGSGYVEALGDTGLVTLTEYVPPGPDAWGMVRGTLDLGFLVTESSASGIDEVISVGGAFAVPIAPTQDGTAASRASAALGGVGSLPPWRSLPHPVVTAGPGR